jgi:apolipoprotein D and lipocalin family protein
MPKNLFFGLSAILILSFHSAGASSMEFTPVGGFELSKYLGTWYEIARMPVSFERDLVGVTATYGLRKDGKVSVLNQGHKKTLQGTIKTAGGKAKFAGKSDVGHLKVSFFGPFYADYIVSVLDSNYQYAMVVGDSYKYLWILSRTPKLDAAILNGLLEKATELGFDAQELYMVPQE